MNIKTICIGNIYLGGTGKTTLAIKINNVLKNMGKTKEGKAVLGAMGDSKVIGFLTKIATKLGKVPFLKTFSKDVKTYGRVFKEAAELSAKGDVLQSLIMVAFESLYCVLLSTSYKIYAWYQSLITTKTY